MFIIRWTHHGARDGVSYECRLFFHSPLHLSRPAVHSLLRLLQILTNTNWPQVGFVQPEEHSYAYTLTDTFPVSESTHFFVVVFPESFLKATDSGALMSRRPPCVVPFPTFLHLQDVPQVTEGVRNVSSLKLSMTLCCGYVEPEVEKGHGPSQGEDYHPFFFFWVVLQWMLPLNSFYYKVYSVLLLTQ